MSIIFQIIRYDFIILKRKSIFVWVRSNKINGDDELMWEYTLFGAFEVVSEVAAVCTSAAYYYTIYGNNWDFSNGDAYASGNTAYGVGTFKRSALFITTQIVDIHLDNICVIYMVISHKIFSK